MYPRCREALQKDLENVMVLVLHLYRTLSLRPLGHKENLRVERSFLQIEG